MNYEVGDYVSRISYSNDTVFKIVNIIDNIVYLKGASDRLCADSPLEDLVKVDDYSDDFDYEIDQIGDRSDYFYLPGKILHIDGDSEYLDRCLNFYKKSNIFAIGKKVSEEDIPIQIESLLNNIKPDIVIITGHDAYYKKKGDVNNINNYKNSKNFVRAVKCARKYEKSHDKLVIIAGACQSDYEELIKAGANFASSPKRINIHALDPAIIAVDIALTERTKQINLPRLLDKTKYGSNGIGGIITSGLMYVGYPR